MNAETLIEKRKSQLNLILNWTLNSNTNTVSSDKKLSDTDKQSLVLSESSISSLDDLARKNENVIASSSVSPNPDEQSLFDSLSNLKLAEKVKKTKNDDFNM